MSPEEASEAIRASSEKMQSEIVASEKAHQERVAVIRNACTHKWHGAPPVCTACWSRHRP